MSQREKNEKNDPSNVFDVLVIGGGPAGYVAAIRAAQLGGNVALVEEKRLGGTCLNQGCIPTQALIESANLLSRIRRATEYGIVVDKVSIDFPAMMDGIKDIVTRLTLGLEQLMKANNIRVIKGRAALITPTSVEITQGETKTTVNAMNIIIATGSKPAETSVAGAITTDRVFELKEAPKRTLIAGTNEIGMKFAFILNELGSAVTLIDSADRMLSSEDKDIASMLRRSIKRRGVSVLTNTRILTIRGNEKGEKKVALRTGEEEREIVVDEVLLTGRTPNTDFLGLEKVCVKLENGKIVVNDRMETNVRGLYAAGDVTGGCYAHTAFAEGVVAAENASGLTSALKSVGFPRSVFIHPEVASVGLTEAQARSQGYDLKIGKFMFLANGGALVTREPEGLVKIIAEAETGEILGVHIIGPRATDLIVGAVLGMNLEATIEDFAEAACLHPTLSEALKEAALDAIERPIHKAR